MAKARLVGINHVALEVGDLEAALDFYGRAFDFELRGEAPGMAFLDMGDQFIALSERTGAPADEARHLGLVVDDASAVRHALEEAGALKPSLTHSPGTSRGAIRLLKRHRPRRLRHRSYRGVDSRRPRVDI